MSDNTENDDRMGALLALEKADFPTLDKFQTHLTKEWQQNVEIGEELTASDGGARFLIDGQTVVVMYQAVPYPNDMEYVYSISNWHNSPELMKQHTSHILLLVFSEKSPAEKLY